MKILLRKILICCSLLASFSLISQEKDDDLQNIITTIENYYNGYILRDYSLLEKAFDTENGIMKVPILKDEKIIGYQNNFFKYLIQKWSSREKLSEEILKKCKLTILNIDAVNAQIASAKISMKVDNITYIDILSIQKIEGIWKITNKIFVIDQ
ncbi:nuclear transport factor 2 family protein [Polaribacter sp.]|uniref:nuclear transport factor 2 family protein n=1 Tax=Polaribacter sp. TaxID=1920175 RepID=UPI00404728A8